ncbi:MAG: hypothetical protein AAFV87_03470 [Pseudomonadota bacterium]
MSGDNINDLEMVMYETLVPGRPEIKVAMLIVRAFGTDDLPAEDSIEAALERLAERQDIETFGMIKRWRHSEVRRLFTTSA